VQKILSQAFCGSCVEIAQGCLNFGELQSGG
jgi:hypothetical protein